MSPWVAGRQLLMCQPKERLSLFLEGVNDQSLRGPSFLLGENDLQQLATLLQLFLISPTKYQNLPIFRSPSTAHLYTL